VKNQGQCGSCWAFSAVAAIESERYLMTGELVDLSEQQLLDCDDVDEACEGGFMDTAFDSVEQMGGLCTYDSYPYEAEQEVCHSCDTVAHSDVKMYGTVMASELSLMQALSRQPISIAIEADQMSFQFYESGVYDDEYCGEDIDHGVIAVGYGTDYITKKDYWLVKNSWSEQWGDRGYIRIARNSTAPTGMCGVYTYAVYPITE